MKIKTMLRFLLCFLMISGLGGKAYANVGDNCNGNINIDGELAICDCDTYGYALESDSYGGYKHKATLQCECKKLITYDKNLKSYICKDTSHYAEIINNAFVHSKKTLYKCTDGKVVYDHEGYWYYCECEQYGTLSSKKVMQHKKSRICGTCQGTVNYSTSVLKKSSCSTGHIVTGSTTWKHTTDNKMIYVCEKDKNLIEIVDGEKYHCGCGQLVNKTPSAEGKYTHLAELKCSSCTGFTKANIKYDNNENEYYCDREKCYVKLSKNLWYHDNKMTGLCENGKIVNTYDKNIYYCECNYFVNKSSNNTYKHDLKKLKTCSEHKSNITYDKNVKSYICSGVKIEYKNGKWIHSNATQEFCENNKNLLKITDTIRHCECDTYGYVTSEWDENGNYPHETLLKCGTCSGQVKYDNKSNSYLCADEGNYVELTADNKWEHLEKTNLLCVSGKAVFEFGNSGKYYCDCGKILVGDASKSEANRKHARSRICNICNGTVNYISSKDRYACTSGVLLSYPNGAWAHTSESSSFCQAGKNITRQNNGDYHCECGYLVKQTVKGGEYKHLAELKCRMCGSKVIYESTDEQKGRYYCSNTTLEVKLDNNKWYVVLCPTGNVVKEFGASGKFYCDCGYFINKEVKETSSFEKPKTSWVHGISRECADYNCNGMISYSSTSNKYYCSSSNKLAYLGDDGWYHDVSNTTNLKCENDGVVYVFKDSDIYYCKCDGGYLLELNEKENESIYEHTTTLLCHQCNGMETITYSATNEWFCSSGTVAYKNDSDEWYHNVSGTTTKFCENGTQVTRKSPGIYVCECKINIGNEGRYISVLDNEVKFRNGSAGKAKVLVEQVGNQFKHVVCDGAHFDNYNYPDDEKYNLLYLSVKTTDGTKTILICPQMGEVVNKNFEHIKCEECGVGRITLDYSSIDGSYQPIFKFTCTNSSKCKPSITTNKIGELEFGDKTQENQQPDGNHTVAQGGPSASYFFNAGAEQAKKGYEAVDSNLSAVLHIQSLIMMIATYVGVIVIVIYGIQWTMATPSKRQELKSGFIPLALGVILLIVGPRLAIIIVEAFL